MGEKSDTPQGLLGCPSGPEPLRPSVGAKLEGSLGERVLVKSKVMSDCTDPYSWHPYFFFK